MQQFQHGDIVSMRFREVANDKPTILEVRRANGEPTGRGWDDGIQVNQASPAPLKQAQWNGFTVYIGDGAPTTQAPAPAVRKGKFFDIPVEPQPAKAKSTNRYFHIPTDKDE